MIAKIAATIGLALIIGIGAALDLGYWFTAVALLFVCLVAFRVAHNDHIS